MSYAGTRRRSAPPSIVKTRVVTDRATPPPAQRRRRGVGAGVPSPRARSGWRGGVSGRPVRLVDPRGIEPPAVRSRSGCSGHLSYGSAMQTGHPAPASPAPRMHAAAISFDSNASSACSTAPPFCGRTPPAPQRATTSHARQARQPLSQQACSPQRTARRSPQGAYSPPVTSSPAEDRSPRGRTAPQRSTARDGQPASRSPQNAEGRLGFPRRPSRTSSIDAC